MQTLADVEVQSRRSDIADYVAQMTGELAMLADNFQLGSVTLLLGAAKYEAELCRSSNVFEEMDNRFQADRTAPESAEVDSFGGEFLQKRFWDAVSSLTLLEQGLAVLVRDNSQEIANISACGDRIDRLIISNQQLLQELGMVDG